MKFGHVEAHLRAANPRSWRDEMADFFLHQPTIVVVVGAGAAVLTCTGLAYWLLARGRKRPGAD